MARYWILNDFGVKKEGRSRHKKKINSFTVSIILTDVKRGKLVTLG